VTTSSEDKVSRLKAVGADDVINYRTTPDWHIAVRELTKGRGVDQVVDVGGGTLDQSIQSVGLEGQVNFIGRLSDQSTTINLNILYNAVATLRVVFAGQPRTIHRDEPCDCHQPHETSHRSRLSFR
jgi:NADPH:quinone reductase-like Zn-dependent oxidoreductase